MNANEWLDSLPNNPGTERDKMVLDAVSSGLATCDWSDVTSTVPGHTAVFQVCSDALAVTLDDGSRFRPQVSARLAQQCADALGVSLPTAKICDLAFHQAVLKLNAVTLPAGPDMVTTAKSKQYNVLLEVKRAGETGLVRDAGKAWILSNRLGEKRDIAINHGFYSRSGPDTNQLGDKLYQSSGGAHNWLHQDYSQLLLLVKSTFTLDGEEKTIADIFKDPVLSHLLNWDGILHFTRQPG